MKKIIFLVTLFFALFLEAQNIKTYLYKGFIDNRPVTLFLKSEDNQCMATLKYTGMYQYDKVSNWLQLDITENDKNQFAMVEAFFTGVLVLKKQNLSFSGVWISPDSKKQLKVELKPQKLSKSESEKLDQKLDEVNYENYDC